MSLPISLPLLKMGIGLKILCACEKEKEYLLLPLIAPTHRK